MCEEAFFLEDSLLGTCSPVPFRGMGLALSSVRSLLVWDGFMCIHGAHTPAWIDGSNSPTPLER